MDFVEPRFRIETTATDLHLVRVINGEESWRKRRSGAIEDVPPDLFEDEMRWYAAHLYRTIHRLATRDPALSVRVNEKERLEIHTDEARLLWFALDAKGEPGSEMLKAYMGKLKAAGFTPARDWTAELTN